MISTLPPQRQTPQTYSQIFATFLGKSILSSVILILNMLQHYLFLLRLLFLKKKTKTVKYLHGHGCWKPANSPASRQHCLTSLLVRQLSVRLHLILKKVPIKRFPPFVHRELEPGAGVIYHLPFIGFSERNQKTVRGRRGCGQPRTEGGRLTWAAAPRGVQVLLPPSAKWGLSCSRPTMMNVFSTIVSWKIVLDLASQGTYIHPQLGIGTFNQQLITVQEGPLPFINQCAKLLIHQLSISTPTLISRLQLRTNKVTRVKCYFFHTQTAGLEK